MTTEKKFFIFIKIKKEKKQTTKSGFFKQKISLPKLFVNNYELSETEKLIAIKYWSRMNELTCFNWNYSKLSRKLSQNDKFVTNKTKICLFQ